MNNFCNNCGISIVDGNSFCSNCGTKIEVNTHNLNNNNQIKIEENNGLKVASLILGIISIVFSLIFSFFIIPLAILGLILGIIYTSRMKKICAGIVLNILGIIIPIIMFILIIVAFVSINSSYEEMVDDNYDHNTNFEDYIYHDDVNDESGNLQDDFTTNDNNIGSYFIDVKFNDIINFISKKETFVMVISQTGCSHCIKYKPKVENVANKLKLNIYYIEYDLLSNDEKETFSNYILFSGTPTTVFFINGSEKSDIRIVGNSIEEEELEQLLKDNGYIK